VNRQANSTSSGYGLNGNSGDIVKSGCDGFIQKPFDLNALSQKINDIVKSATLDTHASW